MRLMLTVLALGLVAISVTAYLNLVDTSRSHVPLTDAQLKLLSGDPHYSFYAARRWEELPASNLLRKLPRYMGINLFARYFQLHPAGYARVVARHIPFRISDSGTECAAGLEGAAILVFQKPVAQLTHDELQQLLRFSRSPTKFPAATPSP